MTRPESLLWSLLRRDATGLHFRRQHPYGPYILDFYCAKAQLCVEVDGPVHADQAESDERRSAWLEAEGIKTIRFTAEHIEQRPAAVLADIARAASPSTA